MKDDSKRMDATLPNQNTLICGASGSGKSAYLRDKVNWRAPRIFAWDVDEDFNLPRVRSMSQFEKIVRKKGFGACRVALTVEPTEENFEHFCKLVFAVGHAKAPMILIVEELADVARTAKASKHWGMLIRRARKYGISVYVVTQAPQEIDKTTVRQCRFKFCGALEGAAAWRTMADNLRLKVADMEQLENIERKQVQYWLKEGTKPAEKHTLKFK